MRKGLVFAHRWLGIILTLGGVTGLAFPPQLVEIRAVAHTD